MKKMKTRIFEIKFDGHLGHLSEFLVCQQPTYLKC